MKAAVYAGTRNLYKSMETAAKSLIKHSSVEKIYFLIEDDAFPGELPPMIETINVSGQKYFPKTGANFKTRFTYMSLLRVCYSKLFPEVDRILQLDVDTVVVDNIDSLWDLDLTEKYFAAVVEDLSTYKPYGPTYYNIGVAMFNLDYIRQTGMDDTLIDFLNLTKVPYIDQDAWNRYANAGNSLPIDTRFNESCVTGFTDHPAIVHYAGHKDWRNTNRCSRREYIRKFEEMTWEEVLND